MLANLDYTLSRIIFFQINANFYQLLLRSDALM